MYDAMLAETVTIAGDNGDEIEAYSARTLQPGPVGGVSSSTTCPATTGRPRSSPGRSRPAGSTR
jgi:hypothetical protein